MVLWEDNSSGLILVFSSRENLQKDLRERESTADEFDAMRKVVLTWYPTTFAIVIRQKRING
ncbi:hypothetical protein TNCV_1115061 [Trichonephila clavipes]|nr:hypothetical protein TNCV_1115061 [Trichonephila clavipes]